MKEQPIGSGELDLSRIHGILFDVDGTLSDTDDHWVERITRFLNPMAGLFADRDPKRFARWITMSIETPGNYLYNLTDRLGIDKPLLNFSNRLFQKSRSRRPPQDRFLLIPGVKEMLENLHGKYPMGVVSARDELTTLAFLDLFDLTPYFDVVVTAHTCEHTKPFPDPIIFAAEALGLVPGDCLMVGDTIVDIIAGRMAGAQTVAVLCGFGQPGELKKAGANMILSSTAELDNLLESMEED